MWFDYNAVELGDYQLSEATVPHASISCGAKTEAASPTANFSSHAEQLWVEAVPRQAGRLGCNHPLHQSCSMERKHLHLVCHPSGKVQHSTASPAGRSHMVQEEVRTLAYSFFSAALSNSASSDTAELL